MSRRKKRHRKREKRATKVTGLSPQSGEYWVDKFFGGGSQSSAGVPVTEETALTASAFFCEPSISELVSLAASAERWARFLTSSATTENPLPASPARAA